VNAEIGWDTVPIGQVAEVYDGPHATPKKTDSGPVFLGISSLDSGRLDLTDVDHLSEDDFKKWTRRVEPRAGDVVFSYETRIGQAAIIPEGLRCCLGRRLALVRPDSQHLDPRFFLYQYLGPDFQRFLESRTNPGSTVNRIHLTEFPEYPIRLPSLDEQRAIARILGALDDKIELNREMNRTLEATAQAIFRSWFVDFDPVVAKADGRKPFGMSDKLAALFPDRLVESDSGPIPEGWDLKPVSQAVRVNPKRSLKKGEVAPYLAMANAPTHAAIPHSWEKREYGSGVCFKAGDTLMAKITPCLENGKTAFVGFLDEGVTGWGSTEFIVLAPRGAMPAEFPYFLARDEDFRGHAIANMTGSSGRQRVPVSALRHYQIVVPSSELLVAFSKVSRPIMRKLVENVRESQTLAALRDLLLPKLLSGEIRVAEAESTVEAAL